MKFNVSQQLKEYIGSTRNYEINNEVVAIGDSDNIMVQGQVQLLRTHRSILAKGTLHTEVEITCSRCLSSFSCHLHLNFEEEYFPTVDIVSGTSLLVPEEPVPFTIDGHHVLDLTETIRQHVLMATPMKPLCRDDCAGLCPRCGYNLNQGSCSCTPKEMEPRWSELTDGLSNSPLKASRLRAEERIT